MNPIEQPTRALVLSGGGGRGAYQVGVYKALEELDRAPAVIVGTSIGAINGAMIASGHNAASLEHEWRLMNARRVHRLRRDVWRILRWPGLLSTDPWARTLQEQIDFTRLADSPIQLRITATEIESGQLRVFDNAEITVRHLLASCSIPIVYPWTILNGAHYWDGAVMAATPLAPAIDSGADEIVVVLLSPVGARRMPLAKNLVRAAGIAFELALLASFENDLKQLQRVNDLVLSGRDEAHREISCIVIAPSEHVPLEWILTYDADQIDHLIELGYRDALAALMVTG
ncbi:MAG: patatin-like phospholipase family protein [Anaerolineales bacterium]